MRLTMPLTLIIWFTLLITGCVLQQQPHVELQLPIDYNVHRYETALDAQESTSYPISDSNITFSIALATSASEQNNSSAGSFRATSAELRTNGGSATGAATLLSSTDDYDSATTTNRLTKTETEVNTTYRSTASTELGTDSGSSTATATLNSGTDEFAGATSTSRLMKNETDSGTSARSTVSAELGATNGSSSATTGLLSSTVDYADASTTTRFTKNETDVGVSSQSTAGIAERGTNTSLSSSATATTLSSTENYSVARNADGDLKIQVDQDPVDQFPSWRIAAGVLALVVIVLLVVTAYILIFNKERDNFYRSHDTTRLPGDIEMSAMPSLRLPSSGQNRNNCLSSSKQSELGPSSEVIVL